MNKPIFILLLFFVLGITLACASNRRAIPENKRRKGPPPIDLTGIERIENNGVTVCYSKGFKEVAIENLERLNKMVDFYKATIDIEDFKFTFALLAKEDYPDHAKEIYGMPFCSPEQNIVVVPATDDGCIVQATLPQLRYVDQDTLDLFEAGGVTPEQGVKMYPLLIGYHEFGHIITESFGLKLSQPINEFTATYFAITFLDKFEPEIASIYEANINVSPYKPGEKPKYTDIDSFSLGKVNPDDSVANYDWFQKEFNKIAFEISETLGLDYIIKFKEKLGTDRLSTREELKLISEITPAFENWMKENR